MTRAEFIQRAALRDSTSGSSAEAIKNAVSFADALEKSGAAPWTGSGPDTITWEHVLAEREECAKIADKWLATENYETRATAEGIASGIRGRGDK